jgi:hypothetical protein
MSKRSTYTLADYRRAAEVLWGEAGAWAVDEYQRHNLAYFGGELPPVPIVIGLTAYGHCLGITRHEGEWSGEVPRITLQSPVFAKGTLWVSDIIIHEMVHAKLMLAQENVRHNARPWCAEIERLSPLVLGRSIKAAPVNPRRIGGKNVRLEHEGHLSRDLLSRWPYSIREGGDPGLVLQVSSY